LSPENTAPRRIVVGIDFSAGASAALAAAAKLGDAGSQLELVHVASDYVHGSLESSTQAVEWAQKNSVDLSRITVIVGRPWIELVRHATVVNASVIVVGSHGTGGPHPLAMGSNAARLPLSAPCPVVVVGPRDHGWEVTTGSSAVEMGSAAS
jgi:nucleotide-binding universal stress UspA family protein